MNRVYKLIISFTTLLLFQSCSKKQDITPVSNLYIGGFTADVNGTYEAVYWQNGYEVLLSKNASVTGAAIDGGNLYFSGYQDKSYGYWKNGIFKAVFTTTPSVVVEGIAVKDNDIYMIGFNEYYKSTCWKNGNEIGPGGNTIAITGNDVYVGGSIDNRAVYWKNGEPTYLAGPKSAILGINVHGSDIYMCGYTQSTQASYSVACVWKNGKLVLTADTASIANGVAVKDNDVYMAGTLYRNTFAATVWKNKEMTILPSNAIHGFESSAKGIITFDGDVYIAGQIVSETSGRSNAVYWKNGQLHVLNSGPSLANCIISNK